jgi:hypothetical protein
MNPTTVGCPKLACPASGQTGQGNIGIHAQQGKDAREQPRPTPPWRPCVGGVVRLPLLAGRRHDGAAQGAVRRQAPPRAHQMHARQRHEQWAYGPGRDRHSSDRRASRAATPRAGTRHTSHYHRRGGSAVHRPAHQAAPAPRDVALSRPATRARRREAPGPPGRSALPGAARPPVRLCLTRRSSPAALASRDAAL